MRYQCCKIAKLTYVVTSEKVRLSALITTSDTLSNVYTELIAQHLHEYTFSTLTIGEPEHLDAQYSKIQRRSASPGGALGPLQLAVCRQQQAGLGGTHKVAQAARHQSQLRRVLRRSQRLQHALQTRCILFGLALPAATRIGKGYK